MTSELAKATWARRKAKARNAFWQSIGYPNTKLAGQANALKAAKRREQDKRLGIERAPKHTVSIKDREWRFAESLAAQQPGWVTVNAYLRSVILDHLDREAIRRQWETEHGKRP